MSMGYTAAERLAVESVLADARFSELAKIPKFAWQELGIIAGAYLCVIGGIYLCWAGWLPYPVLLITSALATYAAFTPLHDSTHRSLSNVGWLNDLLGTLSAQILLPGFTCGLYRSLHLQHHRYTGDPQRDPDEFMVSKPLLIRPLCIMFVDLFWMPWYFKRWNELSNYERIRDSSSILLNVAWHVGWLLSPYAWEFLKLWMMPQRLGILTVGYLFASIQHPEGVLQSEQALQATRMIKGGRLNHWFMIAQSQHLMHHLFPMLPYYRYNHAWALAQPKIQDFGLVWDHSFPPPDGREQAVAAKNPSAGKRISVQVVHVESVAQDVRAYLLAAADGADLPPYEPGAHIDVHLAPNLVRQYSLTGMAPTGQYAIAVKLEPAGRGGSAAVHEQFHVGHRLEISQPRNLFQLQEFESRSKAEAKTVLIAGGIGITPLWAMAARLAERNQPFEFHVCARSEAALPFSENFKKATFAKAIEVHIGQRLVAADLPKCPAESHLQAASRIYLCGPEGFMNHVRQLAAQRGWPESAIVSEHFTAPETARGGAPFEVRLAQSGRVLSVGAEESLLDVLQSNKLPLTASCEQGMCATCLCAVLEGEVEHRDVVLSDEQKQSGLMTSCVSRAKGASLTLDL